MKWEMVKCDRCGKEGKKDELKLRNIVIDLNGEHYYGKRYESFQEWRADWCDDCCNIFHLLDKIQKYKKDRPVDSPQPPTIEDMIREIVREGLTNQ